MYDLVIENGKVVSADRVFEASVCVKNGRIAAILDHDIRVQARKAIDAKGHYVFPGAIDAHAHMNDPGFNWREDFVHGTAAAGIGGFTTLIDMPLQNEPALTDGTIFDRKERAVSGRSYIDYCFWGGLVDYNLESLMELDEKGCVAFKSFIGPVSPDYVSLSLGQVKEAMEILKDFDGRAGFHCEDYSIIKHEEARALKKKSQGWQDFLNSRPVIAELIATQNILELAKEVGAKVHICHVSHPRVAQAIRQAQLDGVDVTAETCSHYLTFSDEDLLEKGSLYKCAPPLREAEAVEKLWDFVADGTLCCVASDHSPCTSEEKDVVRHGVFGAWGGISGIQSVMQVMFSEGVVKRGHSPTLLSRVLSEGPAKTFGIYGKKGAIEVGFDADLVVLDPEKTWEIKSETLHYTNKISAYEGLKGTGLPVLTLVRGEIIAQDGRVIGRKGFGELVKKTNRSCD